MKRFCIIFFLLLSVAYSMSAQDITGKWECSKELLDRLQLRYDTMKGHYTFKPKSVIRKSFLSFSNDRH